MSDKWMVYYNNPEQKAQVLANVNDPHQTIDWNRVTVRDSRYE